MHAALGADAETWDDSEESKGELEYHGEEEEEEPGADEGGDSQKEEAGKPEEAQRREVKGDGDRASNSELPLI